MAMEIERETETEEMKTNQNEFENKNENEKDKYVKIENGRNPRSKIHQADKLTSLFTLASQVRTVHARRIFLCH